MMMCARERRRGVTRVRDRRVRARRNRRPGRALGRQRQRIFGVGNQGFSGFGVWFPGFAPCGRAPESRGLAAEWDLELAGGRGASSRSRTKAVGHRGSVATRGGAGGRAARRAGTVAPRALAGFPTSGSLPPRAALLSPPTFSRDVRALALTRKKVKDDEKLGRIVFFNILFDISCAFLSSPLAEPGNPGLHRPRARYRVRRVLGPLRGGLDLGI